jgi:thioredoxin reductase (NADPH)
VVVAGGGDSALDWSIYLVENKIAKELTLVHRNSSFRGHLDSVQKVMDLADAGKIKLVTEAEVRWKWKIKFSYHSSQHPR